MNEQKMGTNYVREIAKIFHEAAADCKYSDIKEKLISLANEMEPLAGKLYFKTQKGTEEMEQMRKKVEGLSGKLAACDQGGAQSFCIPVFSELDRILVHVKTMKVRMT